MDGDYTGEDEANPSCSWQLETGPAIAAMESLQEEPGKDSGGVPETNDSHHVEARGDSVEGGSTADVASLGPSSAVDEGAGEVGKSANLTVEDWDSVAEVGDSRPGGGNMEWESGNLVEVVGERDSEGGDVAEDEKGVFNRDELPLQGEQVTVVGEGEVLTDGEKKEQAELGEGERMTDGEDNQMAENEAGQRTATEQLKEEVNAMIEETIAQDAASVDIVDERETPPNDKELASLAGFTDILPQGNGSGDNVHKSLYEHEEKEPSQEAHAVKGAKDVSDGEARVEVDVKEDILDGQCVQVAETEVGVRIEEERKADVVEREHLAVVENQDESLDVAATEAAEEKEALVDELSADAAQFAGETGNRLEPSTVDVEDLVEKEEEAGKSETIRLTEPLEELETFAKDEMGIEEKDNSAKNEAGLGEEVSNKNKMEREEENNGMASEAASAEMIDVEEAAEESEEETKIDEKRTEETEVSGDEGQKEDNDEVDESEDMETLGDSSVADEAEGRGNLLEEMGMAESAETQEEAVTAEAGEEEPQVGEDGEEENKTGGKRKRGRNSKGSKGSGKKKEEDVCFMCFDGGDLVLCDRRGCPKAYHPTCVGRDEAFFQSKDKWHCGWHLCSKCEKLATYLCYTCMFSLCKSCTKDAVFFCIRGNKGLCETCMETVKLIESQEQAQLDFDDKGSWEYLFKDYWIDLKAQLSLSKEDLDQAKSPWKGRESHANKMESPNKINYTTDGGSDSDTVTKKKKTKRQSKSRSTKQMLSTEDTSSLGENVEWASKELLDVVMHMRHGDRSFVPRSEVHNLLLEYIKRYKLRDPRRKSQVICDSRLQNLFGKSHVGHFEMLNLLDSHFLVKEGSQAEDLQENVVRTEASHLEDDENSDQLMKSGKDKRRKTRKKGDTRGRQSNLDEYAAIDMHNINLMYLRRNLVEDLLEDATAFQDKVVGAFVRLRISGNQKQDLYRLVQVVGTSKAPEPYKVGKKTTDFVLEILNLDKTELISMDIISNQDFTEDECKRLRQSIKCGLINRLTVGDIQEKAIVLQEVRVKNLLEAEIMRFSHLRDRASDMGRRKELRECVEKLQVLKSPEERQRRLEEIPDIHADPSMDPNCESEDEEKEEKKKDKYLKSRSSSFNKRGREPISPRRGGFSSNDSLGGTRNPSSGDRELSRNLSGRGFSSRGDHLAASDDRMNENVWSSGRDREMQQSVISERPRSVYTSEAGARSSRSVATHELSPRVVSDVSAAPSPASVPQTVPQINESEKMWHYKDPSGKVQGPFSMLQLRKWSKSGYFPIDLRIWKTMVTQDDSTLLTDALAGKFHKQTPLVDNSSVKAQPALYSIRASGPELSSTNRAVPSTLEIPKSSKDGWSSGTNLPSPTPHQTTTPTPARRRNFESRWSPTPAQQSVGSAVQLMNSSIPQPGLTPAPKLDISMLRTPAGAPQIQTQTTVPSESRISQSTPHPLPTPNPATVTVNHLGSVTTLPSPTPPSGKQQGLGTLQAQKLDSGGSSQIPSHGHRSDAPSSAQNSSLSFSTGTPNVFPQPGFPPPNSWRVPVPNQANAQPSAAPNLPWGMNMGTNQNPTRPQAPGNQNSGLGPVLVNPNMGRQAGSNMSWGSVPTPAEPIPGWVGPSQGQAQMYPNPSWGMTGQAQAQAPGNAGLRWMQPGQGPPQPGNPNWASPALWGSHQNHNGDSGYGWNRQPPSTFGGSGGPSSKGQRICKFYRENGYCKKGASCEYIHN